ncbi:MAG TPA: ABC transporter ATP-binding protein [Anaerolineaceae bacterium]|nr:ABC transporter ATP-binding protein [Anaerolineaceae bacterium]
MEGNTQPLVSMRGIWKSFPGIIANQDVNLDLYAGQVHALLGENGAGKSTLMNILAGLYLPDAGEILIHGQQTAIPTPRRAFELGIGMVHQHFMLVDSFTAVENIVLGMNGPALKLDLRSATKQIQSLSEQYNLDVPMDIPVGGMTVGIRQRVEILRLLFRQTSILIFDEPTAVLTPQEADTLGRIIRSLSAEGKAVVYITHKLREVLEFSHMVTVLRGGKIVATQPVDQVSESQLVEMMIGERFISPTNPGGSESGIEALRLVNVQAMNDAGSPALREVNICVQKGEILGIAGVSGNGQMELAEILVGLRKLTGGEIWLNGKNVSGNSARQLIDNGVAYVPGERMRYGLVGPMTVAENLVIKGYRRKEFQKGIFLNYNRMTYSSREIVREHSIKVPDEDMPIHLLSGGNQQKVILARELHEPHLLLIVENPTRGLDVKSTAVIHQMLLKEREQGNAVLLISSDLDELLALSDRIAVMYAGRIVGEMSASGTSPLEIGNLMTGRGSGSHPS